MIQPIRKRVAEANGIDTTKYFHTLLIDGNNLMKIAFVNKEMNNEGKQYGMIVTALRLIGEILKRKDFNYCVIAFDGEQSGILRYQYYKDYKANRDKNYGQHEDAELDKYLQKFRDFQKMVISKSKENASTEEEDESFKRQGYILKQILQELCIRQYEFDRVEGDDIISYYIKNKKDNEKVVIVSSDRDLTQLISDTVIIYNPRKKIFINKRNAVDEIGIIPENIVLEKVICGDVSDNIKGVKGVGNKTLTDLFPQIRTEKIDLSFIMRRSKELLEERKANKKKPLKSLENILNGVTDGCQGDKLYEINQKIIDLSTPLLTNEAIDTMNNELYAPIDTSELSIKNAYDIIKDNNINEILDETKFGNILEPFDRIQMMENKRWRAYNEELKQKN
jgi:5'-3' exonuclease